MNWIDSREQLPPRGERVVGIFHGHAQFTFISTYGLPLWVLEASKGVAMGAPTYWARLDPLPEPQPLMEYPDGEKR